MNQESIINQKEYLKRYLSGKNKKKRKKKDKVTVGRLVLPIFSQIRKYLNYIMLFSD